MITLALASDISTLRLAATQLPNFKNSMDADHIHAWEQGNLTEALVGARKRAALGD